MDKKHIITYSIILTVIILLFIYMITVMIRFNKSQDTLTTDEVKLNQLVINLNKEKRNSEKMANINNEKVTNLFFTADVDFYEYIRSIFSRHRVNVNIYQSKDSDKNLEVILNYNINTIEFFKIIKEIENGQKFLTINSVTVKKDNYPVLKIYMKITGYYR
jgi:flagella basal body P-ring formation protein FlgA